MKAPQICPPPVHLWHGGSFEPNLLCLTAGCKLPFIKGIPIVKVSRSPTGREGALCTTGDWTTPANGQGSNWNLLGSFLFLHIYHNQLVLEPRLLPSPELLPRVFCAPQVSPLLWFLLLSSHTWKIQFFWCEYFSLPDSWSLAAESKQKKKKRQNKRKRSFANKTKQKPTSPAESRVDILENAQTYEQEHRNYL